ncbi:hypothetical protein HDV05_002299 [Chytridiales sp. JEL 0842]|nr:hypothetical protein HDV05_002299 [Chytridiales sp. JEL 0842]
MERGTESVKVGSLGSLNSVNSSSGSSVVGGASSSSASAALNDEKSKTALKNAKKRAAKKKEAEDAQQQQQSKSAAAAAPIPAFIATDTDTQRLEIEKKMKALNKKLKQIAEIKEKQGKGEKLELTQIQKLEGEGKVKEEVEALRKQLEAL